MTPDPMTQVELEPGERLLRGWPVESVGERSSKGSSGWLVLTSQRCLFYRQAGVWKGRQLEKPPELAVKLEDLRSVSARQFTMPIGYGDHIAIPGLEIDGHGFKLNREMPSSGVLAEIAEARRVRSGQPHGSSSNS